jgi:hypothetical protein
MQYDASHFWHEKGLQGLERAVSSTDYLLVTWGKERSNYQLGPSFVAKQFSGANVGDVIFLSSWQFCRRKLEVPITTATPPGLPLHEQITRSTQNIPFETQNLPPSICSSDFTQAQERMSNSIVGWP